MASGIPPSELLTHTNSTASDSSEHFAQTPQPDLVGEVTTAALENKGGVSLAGMAIVAFFFVVVGLFAVSKGAPASFAVFAVIAAIAVIAMGIASRRKEAILEEEKARAEIEAQEKLRNDIAEAVKETIKSNIKVRCRYCGSLNDETDKKCDSCGATL